MSAPDFLRMRPLVPEYAQPGVKLALLPLTLPLAVALMVALALEEVVAAVWEALRG